MFKGPIHSNRRAKQRCRFNRRNAVWNFLSMAGGRFYEFRKTAVYRDASDFLPPAQVFISLATEFTGTAAPMNPWNTDSVPDFQIAYRRALLEHSSGNFVAENQRPLYDPGQVRPSAIG